MNVERLHVIALAIQEDLKKTDSQSTLKKLVDSLQNQVSQPQAPQFQEQVSAQLKTFYNALVNAPSNGFSPAWRQAIEELEIDHLLGNSLENNIREVFERNKITPSVALEEIKSMQEELVNMHDAIDKIVSGFDYFDISAEQLEPGKCELGILVPRQAVKNKLNSFSKELSELDGIFGTFSELAIGKRPDFEIRSISSSELNVFLEIMPPVAVCLVIAVERIITTYKQLLEIRILRKKLREEGVPQNQLSGVSRHANSLMSKTIDKLTPELLDKYFKGDDNRRNELSNELRFSLRKIAKRIDKGYNIDIRIEPISDSEDKKIAPKAAAENARIVDTIRAAYDTLKFISLEGEPILSLPESKRKKKDTDKIII